MIYRIEIVETKPVHYTYWVEAPSPEIAHSKALRGDYGPLVPVRDLKAGLARMFDRATDIQPGDVLLLVVGGEAQHLGIAIDGKTMVHCYSTGPQRVIRVVLIGRWKVRGHGSVSQAVVLLREGCLSASIRGRSVRHFLHFQSWGRVSSRAREVRKKHSVR